MQIPGTSGQLVEHIGFESGQIPAGALKTVHELVFAQAVNGTGRSRSGRSTCLAVLMAAPINQVMPHLYKPTGGAGYVIL